MFYCFGCKEGGNIISFLMKLRGLTFYETITELADQANIHLHHIQRTEYEPSSEVRKLIRANEWLMKLYYHLLRFTKDGKIAYNYLMDRGITKESRSEEHTSELQSRGHLVCRLLLEKKKRYKS